MLLRIEQVKLLSKTKQIQFPCVNTVNLVANVNMFNI